MNRKRRQFLKFTGASGLALAVGCLNGKAGILNQVQGFDSFGITTSDQEDAGISVIGLYGPWAATLSGDELPSFSYRRNEYKDVTEWRAQASKRVVERLSIPIIGNLPKVVIRKKYNYDGLQIEELSWQLPYGRPTEAILLKPLNSKGRLPGILAFHDHGGNKFFGKRKITKTSDYQHPLMIKHQQHYYEGLAWANEIAKLGYVVLVSDAFDFASRRVMIKDVPERIRRGLKYQNSEDPEYIENYNKWAAEHEHIMAKSLFSAGTTWPGVFFAEDQKALDILCSRDDVDPNRIGCAGLSGGGLRADIVGGLDPRIKCAVSVGFMTTWKDFLLNKSFIHTWMSFVPFLPNELDFPEILGLRVPLPTLVLNNEDDPLYTLAEMKRSDEILKEVYSKGNAEGHYKCSFYPGGHKFDKKMQDDAFNWFDKWLK